MSDVQPRNPLHGVTLERIVRELANFFGCERLGERASINRGPGAFAAHHARRPS